MSVQGVCPQCQSKINAPDKFAGKRAKCPKCGGAVAFPKEISSPSPDDHAAPPSRFKARQGMRWPLGDWIRKTWAACAEFAKDIGAGGCAALLVPIVIGAGFALVVPAMREAREAARKAAEATEAAARDKAEIDQSEAGREDAVAARRREDAARDIAAVNRPAAPAPFEIVTRRGSMAFVWIDPASATDRDVYRRAIAEADKGGYFFKAMFWQDRAMMPARLPMSDEQADAQVAAYDRNRNTGLNRLRFLRVKSGESEFSPP
jgi:hypothetical protein